MKPRASIVVVNWNTRALLLQCVQSLEETTRDFPVEIVVVDNGSTDGSADALAARHPNVTLVRSDENLGFSRGNNLGFRHATSDVFILLNSDTIVLPNAIRALVEYLDAHPDAGAVGGQQLDADCVYRPTGNWFPSFWVDLSVVVGLHRHRWWLLERNSPLARLWFRPDTGDVDWLAGSFMAVRRRVIDEVGPLPEEFFMYGEDIEWAWRMKEAGWRRVYLHGAPIIHLKNRSADLLFKNDKPHRVLDGFFTFAARHRNPVEWRASWLLLASYWTAIAARWELRGRLRGNDEMRATARNIRSYAKRLVDQVLGRVPPIASPSRTPR